MLAGHITAPCRIELVEVPEPKLPERRGDVGWIIFEPHLACLCGSDLPFFTRNGEHPVELGQSLHEMIGRVVATNGNRFRPGDRVLAVPHVHRGLFERYALEETRAVPLPEGVPDTHLVLAQPLGTVLFAVRKLPTLVGLDVAIVGQGPMGQLFNAVCRNLGARRVIGLDRVPDRLQVAPRMGATDVACVGRDDAVAVVRELTGGRGAELVVECVGHGDQAFNACIELVAYGGRILYFGVPPETIDGLRWRDLFFKNATVHTSVYPDFEQDFPLAVQWVAERRIPLDPIITHTFPLQQIQTAFETFLEKRDGALKVFVEFPAYRRPE